MTFDLCDVKVVAYQNVTFLKVTIGDLCDLWRSIKIRFTDKLIPNYDCRDKRLTIPPQTTFVSIFETLS